MMKKNGKETRLVITSVALATIMVVYAAFRLVVGEYVAALAIAIMALALVGMAYRLMADK